MKKNLKKQSSSEDQNPETSLKKYIRRADRPKPKESYTIPIVIAAFIGIVFLGILYSMQKSPSKTIIKLQAPQTIASKESTVQETKPLDSVEQKSLEKPKESKKIEEKKSSDLPFPKGPEKIASIKPTIEIELVDQNPVVQKIENPTKQDEKLTKQDEKPIKQEEKTIKENPLEKIFETMLSEAQRMDSIGDYLHLAHWCKENGMMKRSQDLYQKILKMDPENVEVREALGFAKIQGNWIKEEDARKSGYYKYQGIWYSAKELSNKGLILHEGNWLTKKEAMEKGLIQDKKQKESEKKPNLASKEKSKEPEGKKTEQKEIRNSKEPFVFEYKALQFHFPPGNWSKDASSMLMAKSKDVVSSEFIYKEDNYGLVIELHTFGMDLAYIFPPDDTRVEGGNVSSISRAIKNNLEQNCDSFIMKKSSDNSNLYYGTFFYKIDKTYYYFTMNFIKHKNTTYCIIQRSKKDKAARAQYVMDYITKNIVKLKK